MLKQNSGVTNKQYYGMLWCFLEWSIGVDCIKAAKHLPNLVNACWF